MKKTNITALFVKVTMAMGLLALPVAVQAATWMQTAGGTYSWNDDGNWDATFPNGQDATATVESLLTAQQTINLNQEITLGTLSIGTTSGGYTFEVDGNGGSLVFDTSTGNASLTQTSTSRVSTIAADMTLASDLDITNNSPWGLTISGDITEQDGSRAVTLSTKPVVLNGSNSYSGGTTLAFDASGYVEVGTSSALGSGAVATETGTQGRIRFNLSDDTAFSQDMHLLPGNSYALYNAGTGTLSLNGNLSGGSTFYVVSGADGNGGFSLSGSNTATGHLVADNTTLTIENTSAIAGFSRVLLAENWGPEKDVGKVYLANGVNTNKQFTHTLLTDFSTSRSAYLGMSEVGAATISGTLDLNGRNDAANTAVSNIYLDTPDGATLTLSGVIQNTNTYAENNLVKIGDGTVVVTNTNTYGGNTTIDTGTLVIATGGSITSDTSVAATGSIGGGGTITGDLTLSEGAKFFLTGDILSVTGAVSIDSSFGVGNLLSDDWSQFGLGEYTLIDGTATDFASLGLQNWGLENAGTLADGRKAYFQSGSLQLVIIPEPSTFLLLGLAGLALLRRRRR